MFAFGYLFDENLDGTLPEALRDRHPSLPVWQVGKAGAPARGTPDPAILTWCQGANCALVTNNRKSMPGHLQDHIAAGKHVPGIFVFSLGLPTLAVTALLWDLATLSLPGEFTDQIRYFSIRDLSPP